MAKRSSLQPGGGAARRLIRRLLLTVGVAAGALLIAATVAFVWLAQQPDTGDQLLMELFSHGFHGDPKHAVLYYRVYQGITTMTRADPLHFAAHRAAAAFDRMIGNSQAAAWQDERASWHSPRLPGEVQQPTPRGWAARVPEGGTFAYATAPPSSGPSYLTPAPWALAPQPIPPERWVRNLEIGGVVILYRCAADCPALQRQLADLYQRLPVDSRYAERKVVITAYPQLDHLVRLQAWGWTLPLDQVDVGLMTAFYQRHVDKGPEQLP